MVQPRYLLDTNILSALIKQPQGTLAQRLATHAESSYCTSIIVACELRYGAQRKGSERLTQQVEAVLNSIDVLPLEAPTDRHYGEIRAALENVGQPIGHNDLLIAAQARALGLVVVTENMREFSRVPGLLVENWAESGRSPD